MQKVIFSLLLCISLEFTFDRRWVVALSVLNDPLQQSSMCLSQSVYLQHGFPHVLNFARSPVVLWWRYAEPGDTEVTEHC